MNFYFCWVASSEGNKNFPKDRQNVLVYVGGLEEIKNEWLIELWMVG